MKKDINNEYLPVEPIMKEGGRIMNNVYLEIAPIIKEGDQLRATVYKIETIDGVEYADIGFERINQRKAAHMVFCIRIPLPEYAMNTTPKYIPQTLTEEEGERLTFTLRAKGTSK